jgi:hypothetical protein
MPSEEAWNKLDQMRRAATTSVQPSDEDDLDTQIAKLRAQANIDAGVYRREDHPELSDQEWRKKAAGMKAQAAEEGKPWSQVTTTKGFDTFRTTVGQPPPPLIKAAGVHWTQDALDAKAQALYGKDYDEIKDSDDFDDFISKLRKDPDRRQKVKDDLSNYQENAAKIYPDAKDQRDVASADLNLRLNQPEEYGTVTSSHEDNWDDSGLTFHTVVGDDDITRTFAEDLKTGDTWNVSGHPNTPKPAPVEEPQTIEPASGNGFYGSERQVLEGIEPIQSEFQTYDYEQLRGLHPREYKYKTQE